MPAFVSRGIGLFGLGEGMSLMPWLGRFARPFLENRGARVKKRLKLEARARSGA